MLTNFLEIRVDKPDLIPSLKAVCAGYECGEWRSIALSRYLIRDCLLDFSLSAEEKAATTAATAGHQLADAATWLYNSPRYKARGEIGELLLHVVLKQFYGTRALITKIYFKDSPNDTVKGFDSVHVAGNESNLELWLGEVKFYADATKAISDVIGELQLHLQRDYLRTEFVAIKRKLPENNDDGGLFERLTQRNVSLDAIFSRLCIPVLLTYNSDTVGAYNAVSAAFISTLEKEVDALFEKFQKKLPGLPARVHLCLFPLGQKAALADAVHEVIRACQTLN